MYWIDGLLVRLAHHANYESMWGNGNPLPKRFFHLGWQCSKWSSFFCSHPCVEGSIFSDGTIIMSMWNMCHAVYPSLRDARMLFPLYRFSLANQHALVVATSHFCLMMLLQKSAQRTGFPKDTAANISFPCEISLWGCLLLLLHDCSCDPPPPLSLYQCLPLSIWVLLPLVTSSVTLSLVRFQFSDSAVHPPHISVSSLKTGGNISEVNEHWKDAV